jgi:hypothetical protein
MGHKHLLVTQLYRLLRGALKQEHAKRLPQGFVQVAFLETAPALPHDLTLLLPGCDRRA